jgi:hypothetical protein
VHDRQEQPSGGVLGHAYGEGDDYRQHHRDDADLGGRLFEQGGDQKAWGRLQPMTPQPLWIDLACMSLHILIGIATPSWRSI